MAQTIKPGPYGDTASVIADKVRDLPANQGLNNNAMWLLVDAEVIAAQTTGTLIANDIYVQPLSATAGNSGNKHGNK